MASKLKADNTLIQNFQQDRFFEKKFNTVRSSRNELRLRKGFDGRDQIRYCRLRHQRSGFGFDTRLTRWSAIPIEKAEGNALNMEYIESLIEMMARAPINQIELEHDGWRLRIAMTIGQTGSLRPPLPIPQLQPATVLASLFTPRAEQLICAPLSGVFYSSAVQGEPALVSVGDMISEGQTLAILEAMKMLNPIEADIAGRITAIHALNGQPVSSGDPLFSLISEQLVV